MIQRLDDDVHTLESIRFSASIIFIMKRTCVGCLQTKIPLGIADQALLAPVSSKSCELHKTSLDWKRACPICNALFTRNRKLTQTHSSDQ